MSTETPPTYDLFGIENPLIDLLYQVQNELLKELRVEKNHMQLIDEERLRFLLERLRDHAVQREPGGSCANTLIGVAGLGGSCAFAGCVGSDPLGEDYGRLLERSGVQSYLRTSSAPTGSCLILITPDAARTMNTCLGACRELSAEMLPLNTIRRARMLYLTGYLWDTPTQQAAAELALRTAHEAGVPVAFSLADPFCVQRHHKDFVRLLQKYVSLVIGNREEMLALSGAGDSAGAMHILRKWCASVVITLGSCGACASTGANHAYVEAQPVAAVDTTGAGDGFAAGFLHAHNQGAVLEDCLRAGHRFAAKVVQRIGPRLSLEEIATLRN